MPIHVTEVLTPKGRKVVRSEFVAEVTLAEAHDYMRAAGPDSPYASWPFLVVGNVTGVSGEVKKVLQPKTGSAQRATVAVVLTSAIARMLAGLMLRTTGAGHSEFFKNEADALVWIDEQRPA